jgi:hypothetical protein
MTLLNRKGSLGLFAAAAAGAILTASGVALASHTPSHVTMSGGGLIREDIQTDWSATFVTSQIFGALTGSGIGLGVPSGTVRLFVARFNAESECAGATVGDCHVRIVARNRATGAVLELHPRRGNGFSWDTVNTAGPRALGIERSIRLGPGTYTFAVQASTSPSVTLILEAWHFAVETHTAS